MPAPQCASCHKARAALRRPRSGQALCGACFCAALEAEAAPRCPGVSSRGPLLTAPVSPPPGHNADDKAETVLMNFLRGDAGRLARGGGLGSPGEGGALLRCRPLQLASQKEVVLYAHFRRLDYFSEECVYAPEGRRGLDEEGPPREPQPSRPPTSQSGPDF
ncbi:unnamed protein product [Rangifer tarandus platyrhynchus]|uniref:Uncharacterized protein n=1 Tax=Rangifer tarandus platyrhynchus TaxID=3082113 RepID=A0ABN8YMQ1_RANTA|nr:unnamed protein product [Rangifer tarandus platyrhynchus]